MLESGTPFLSQPRAHGALRHELDAIIGQLKPEIGRCLAAQPEALFELHVLPHRMVARFDDVAISFSWVSGLLRTVADGRLLVICWHQVASGVRGMAALKSASASWEHVYTVEGKSPEEWRWRSDEIAGQPCSSANLANEWITRAGVAGTV